MRKAGPYSLPASIITRSHSSVSLPCIEIGCYTPVAYEGIVKDSRSEPQVGRRYFFLPRYCMIQSRHSGVLSFVSRTKDGVRVRVEGIWIA